MSLINKKTYLLNEKKYIFIGALLLVCILFIANYQSIFKSILPPNPVVVSSKSDASSSTIFDFSIKLTGQVRNNGGDGYIVIKAIVRQDGKRYEKTQQKYLKSYDTDDFEFVFDEVKLFKKAGNYDIQTFPLGSLNN